MGRGWQVGRPGRRAHLALAGLGLAALALAVSLAREPRSGGAGAPSSGPRAASREPFALASGPAAPVGAREPVAAPPVEPLPRPAPAPTGLPVSVRIVDREGRPIAGASVRAELRQGWSSRPFLVGVTDGDGRIEGRAPGVDGREARVVVRAHAAGFPPREETRRLVARAPRAPLDVCVFLAAGPTLTVRVLAPGGSPVPGAHVSWDWPDRRGPAITVSVAGGGVTDERGEVRGLLVLPGRLVVEALHPTLGRARLEEGVPDGRADLELELVLRQGLVSPGVVRCETGEPVAHVHLGGEGFASVQSDEEGAFRLVGLAPGRHTIEPWGEPGYATGFEAGEPVEVVLPGRHLLVHLVDAGGEPRAGRVLQLFLPEGEGWNERERTLVTSGDGWAHAFGLEPGVHLVAVDTPAGHAREVPVDVRAQPCATRVELCDEEVPLGRLALDVVDPEGAPVPRWWATLSSPASHADRYGHDAAWSGLLPVAAGRYDVTVRPEDGGPGGFLLAGHAGAEVRADALSRARVVLPRGGRLELLLRTPGTPRVRAGGPRWGQGFFFEPPGGDERPGGLRTLLAGIPLRATRVFPPGELPLFARDPDADLEAQVTATILPGRTTRLELVLAPPAGSRPGEERP